MKQFEDSGPNGHGDSHDDGFTYSCNSIFLTMVCCIKQMVCSLFKLKKKKKKKIKVKKFPQTITLYGKMSLIFNVTKETSSITNLQEINLILLLMC